MRIYFICPVRRATNSTTQFAAGYVRKMEKEGHTIFWPQRDVNQKDPSGFNIVMKERAAIKDADEVHIYWDNESKGSHFDLGMTIALDKRMVHVGSLVPDSSEKSYEKVMKLIIGIDS